MTTKNILSAVGLFVLSLFSPATAPAASSPTMIGVNLSGGEFGSVVPGTLFTNYFYPSDAHWDWAKGQGMELVRVPFRWERVQHDTNGVLDEALWAPDIKEIDKALDRAEARGMRVILDMHNYGGRSLTIDGVKASYKIGTPQLPVSEFSRAWKLLAAHFKDRKSLWGYDIMNEPNGLAGGASAWVPMAQAAVDAIREADTETAIILEGYFYANAASWLTNGAPLINVVDPSNNLIYSAHMYPDYDSSGTWSHGGTVQAELVRADRYPTLEAALQVGVIRIKPFVDWCVANNVRGLVGEYGSHRIVDTANWATILQRQLDYMTINGNGLISGTQWGGGPWNPTYAVGMGQRRNNSDTPFMPMVRNYVSGVGTNFWYNFTLYEDTVTTTADYTYSFVYPNTTPPTITFNTADTSTFFSGKKSISMTYTVPPGEFAGAGIHIRGPLTSGGVGGVDIKMSVIAGHMLSFYAKGTPGANPQITFSSTANENGVDIGSETATGNWVSLGSIRPLTTGWQRYEIPLSAFVNAQLTGATPFQRLRFNARPADGTTYQVNFDRVTISLPSTNTAPVVTVDTSTGESTFFAEHDIPLVATATDANTDDGVDYVEFYANGIKIGIDDTMPYEWTTSFAAEGSYGITALAIDLHGITKQSAAKTLTILANVIPGAPTDLTAIAGRKEVLLSWAPSVGATSYRVKRSMEDGGPYTLIANSNTPSHLDTSLQNNHTYYYVVTAVNAIGESENSAQASARPSNHPAPIPPTGLTATAGDTRILLTWAESPGATNYIVKLNRKEVNENSGVSEQGNNGNAYGHYTVIATVTTNSYIATGLTNDQLYRYVVSAVNDEGESRNSDEIGATPSAAAEPAIPADLTAVAGNAQVALSWTDASGATSFNVKRASVSGGPYTTVASATTTDYTDTSVTNGTNYYYVVSGVKTVWESSDSAEASAKPMLPVPAAPTGLTATSGDTQVVLSWTAAATAASYNVKRATIAGGPYTTVASPTATNYTNTGLANGTTYYYVVSAVNSGGEGADSAEASARPLPPASTVNIYGSATEDGWVLESTATSDVGGTFANSPGKIRIGDDGSNKQYKGILSFDTSVIPDGATITTATLQVKRDVVAGTNPFTTHGDCNVDIRTGGFNGNTALEAADFQAAATADRVAVMSNPTVNGANSTGTLNAVGLSAINKTGVTQFRFTFASGDNGNAVADYLQCNASNDGNAAKRPTLIITYQ